MVREQSFMKFAGLQKKVTGHFFKKKSKWRIDVYDASITDQSHDRKLFFTNKGLEQNKIIFHKNVKKKILDE